MAKQTPLLAVHQRLGATLSKRFGWAVPAHYGAPAQEYRALQTKAVLIDRTPVGRVRARGKDALDLLNRLSTNKLTDLPPGTGAGTVLTTQKGRILDLLLVVARHDHLLYLTGPVQRERVVEWVNFYTFGEDSVLEDVTEATAMIGVHGPQSASVLSQAGCEVGSLPLYASVDAQVGGVAAVAVRTDAAGLPGYDLIVQASDAEPLMDALLKAGAVPAGLDAFETVRVEQGVPASGAELTEEYNPLEARLKGFISFNKGCYVGQEVVARLDTYDKVQRLLMSMRLEGDARPGDALELDGKTVGVLTSVAAVPAGGRVVGLGYVRHAVASVGQRLTVAGRGTTVELLDPPFARTAEAVAAG